MEQTTLISRQAPRTILLTGFEPFAGEHVNPSWELARALNGELIADAVVVSAQLPCRFASAIDALRGAVEACRPTLVLAVGQAGGSCGFALERVAINVDDASIPDNDGAQPVDVPVVPGAPAAYFSRLPIKAIVAGLRDGGFPASISQTAGTFVCNHAFFGLMHALRDEPVRCGFMHIPFLPSQAARHPGTPSLPLQTLVDGTRLALHLGATADEVR